MKAAALKRAEAAAAKAMQQSWTTADGTIAYAGGEPEHDRRTRHLRELRILDRLPHTRRRRHRRAFDQPDRSGRRRGVGRTDRQPHHASTPAVDADNADGEWNTLHVKVVDDRVTVEVNGRTVTENVILENTCAPGEAAYASGAIELLGEGDAAEFRDFYLCELPATPVFELSPEERAEGYEVLFDGRSLHKWTGNTTNYVPQEGTIYVTASYGGKGNLHGRGYGDFILRFEFRFRAKGSTTASACARRWASTPPTTAWRSRSSTTTPRSTRTCASTSSTARSTASFRPSGSSSASWAHGTWRRSAPWATASP